MIENFLVIGGDRYSRETIGKRISDSGIAFLLPLSVGRLPGVGKVTEEKLNNLDMRAVADLQTSPENGLALSSDTASIVFRTFLALRGFSAPPFARFR